MRHKMNTTIEQEKIKQLDRIDHVLENEIKNSFLKYIDIKKKELIIQEKKERLFWQMGPFDFEKTKNKQAS